MSNYPDGVTGRELQIAGPDWEDNTLDVCPNTECNFEGWCESWGYGKTVTIICPDCDHEWTREEDENE